MSDYLAFVEICGGSSHGRAATKEDAIKRCLFFFRDWEDVFSIPEQDITITVVDVDGCGHVSWGPFGVLGTDEKTGENVKFPREKFEFVTRHFVPKKKHRKASR